MSVDDDEVDSTNLAACNHHTTPLRIPKQSLEIYAC